MLRAPWRVRRSMVKPQLLCPLVTFAGRVRASGQPRESTRVERSEIVPGNRAILLGRSNQPRLSFPRILLNTET